MVEIPEEARRHWRIIEELEGQTDRGTAIVGAAYVEERLGQAIASRFVPEVDARQLFKNYGPFATLYGKIDVAYAMGLVGERSHADLHLIRKIRNAFAHVPDPVTFNTNSVADRCRALWMPANILMPGSKSPPTAPRDLFVGAVMLIWNLVWSEMVQKKAVGESAAIIP